MVRSGVNARKIIQATLAILVCMYGQEEWVIHINQLVMKYMRACIINNADQCVRPIIVGRL